MAKTERPHGLYRFDGYTLDAERGELSDESGTIPLRPQSFEVLALLVANAGRVVSKEEFYSHIWRDRAVTDDSLAQCVIDVRRALGDADRRLVRTVPRRGYQFTGRLAAADNAAKPGTAARRATG